MTLDELIKISIDKILKEAKINEYYDENTIRVVLDLLEIKKRKEELGL